MADIFLGRSVPAVIVIAYTLLARKEEQKVIEQFGERYLAYRQRVPMFIPSKGKWRQFMEQTNVSPDKVV